MKILNTVPIVSGVSMYVKGGTLNFLQLANREMFSELMTSRIGSFYDSTKGYVVNGCVNFGSGSTYNISSGSVFFNGEIYLVPAASFTISAPNVAVGVITTTQFIADADPTDFTDGNQRNVHNIRQIVFQSGLSGSGAFNFNDAVNLAYRPIGGIGQTIEWLMPGSSSQNSQLSTYFDSSSLQGIHPLTLGWIIDDGGYVAAGYLASDPKFGSIGVTQGSDTHTIIANEVPVLSVSIPLMENGTAQGDTHPAVTDNNAVQISTYNGTVNTGSPNTPIQLIQRTKTKLKITRYA
ncbi:hypothetical protein [Mucilaginibacter sp. 10I4]|uniref:hypothetical protein n=1 Tax=Mucilaginibacter sp. 10I4 TaxID=3048580 RepID=UPI002B232DC0|nr:hypothetical protein [Mucilaginibacter sp. 10I4]MEB0264079.1 hypothetical protein [Mucilaginibacter sp. 10I4]